MIKRTIVCAVCNAELTETNFGDGFPNWGSIGGIKLNDDPAPNLCPKHLTVVADFIDKLAKANNIDIG